MKALAQHLVGTFIHPLSVKADARLRIPSLPPSMWTGRFGLHGFFAALRRHEVTLTAR
jgi:hypothetical protein